MSTFSKLRMIGVILVLWSLLTIVAPAAAQGETPDPTNLRAVLAWLAGAGASWLVMRLLVLIADAVPGWNDLDANLRNMVKGILIVAVALGAHWLLQQNAWIDQVQPVWAIIVIALAAGWMGERDAALHVRAVQAQEAMAAYQAELGRISGTETPRK